MVGGGDAGDGGGNEGIGKGGDGEGVRQVAGGGYAVLVGMVMLVKLVMEMMVEVKIVLMGMVQ